MGFPRSSKTYFTIVDKIQEYLNSGKCELKNFNELSFEAWRYSEEDNKREKLKKENNIINNLDESYVPRSLIESDPDIIQDYFTEVSTISPTLDIKYFGDNI